MAVVAWIAGQFVPILGPAVLALLLGASVGTLELTTVSLRPEVAFIGTRLLQASIVALGLSVDFGQVLTVAGGSLPVMLGTLGAGLLGIWLLGRLLHVEPTIRGLLAVGTSVCGASAIAAVAPVLEADPQEIAYAVAVVFLFNVAAVIIFPTIGHAFGFSTATFAVWAGTAVNDTSSVLAASFAFGAGAATFAAVVKLSRTVMILPITIGIALLRRDERRGGWRDRAGAAFRRALPWFIVAFLVAALAHSAGLVPPPVAQAAGTIAQLGTVAALAAIGLGTDLQAVRRAGARPLLLGGAGWLLVATTSLGLQALTQR
ncbi:MAG TPA: putative sulfate exporter family transporter [Candidatus Limnocylindrales bacterium]